jgi:hypothetical protein
MNTYGRIARPSLLQSGGKVSQWSIWFLIWVIVLLSTGCSSSGSRVISVSNGQVGQSVVASVGDKIELTLQTIGPGQYGTPVVSSASLKFLEELPAGAPNPGGSRQLYRFEAVTSGQAEITIQHTGGFPQGPTTPDFTLIVKVK